jgi:hypothetical protein
MYVHSTHSYRSVYTALILSFYRERIDPGSMYVIIKNILWFSVQDYNSSYIVLYVNAPIKQMKL